MSWSMILVNAELVYVVNWMAFELPERDGTVIRKKILISIGVDYAAKFLNLM